MVVSNCSSLIKDASGCGTNSLIASPLRSFLIVAQYSCMKTVCHQPSERASSALHSSPQRQTAAIPTEYSLVYMVWMKAPPMLTFTQLPFSTAGDLISLILVFLPGNILPIKEGDPSSNNYRCAKADRRMDGCSLYTVSVALLTRAKKIGCGDPIYHQVFSVSYCPPIFQSRDFRSFNVGGE
jgi:hypothetical protein